MELKVERERERRAPLEAARREAYERARHRIGETAPHTQERHHAPSTALGAQLIALYREAALFTHVAQL